MKSAGRLIACSLCAMITTGFISVSAKWVEAGYDTTQEGSYGKIYNEIIDGVSSSNHKIISLPPSAITWKAEGFEEAYPHAGYDRLYLEGKWQDITRYNNTFAQWETRTKDFMWEITWPYEIYQRQQTNIPGLGWRWDVYPQDESKVFSATNRYASVKVNFRPFGVANLTVDGKKINSDIEDMYNEFGIPTPISLNEILPESELTAKTLGGEFVLSDADIAAKIPVISSKVLTGPALVDPAVKDVAQSYLANAKYNWPWDSDVVKVDYNANIGWTHPLFEMAEPYLQYQFLIVNGMVMDGSGEKPRVLRMTGGKATPNVTWKYEFAQKDYPYSIVEGKYINGKAAYENNERVYRIPTGEYANSTVKETATHIEVWINDNRGGSYKIDSFEKVRGVIGEDGVGNALGIVPIP